MKLTNAEIEAIKEKEHPDNVLQAVADRAYQQGHIDGILMVGDLIKEARENPTSEYRCSQCHGRGLVWTRSSDSAPIHEIVCPRCGGSGLGTI